MYESFFELKESPFNLTPDPRFLFMSRSHREAFDHLLFGVRHRRGFIEVVGGIGTGKTTLCRAFLEELEGEVSTALIFNTFLSEIELLKAVNEEFGIDASGTTPKVLIDALNRFLIERLANGGNACLILDECQNLQVPALEQIRMLSNLETETEKLLQIVLVGQPEFHEMLKSPQLRQLDERINVRSFLQPLDQEDTRSYIQHRLTVAGSKGQIIFTEEALRNIYHYSRGNPRRVNAVCDRCLLIAYSQDTFRITGDHARQAVLELRGGGWVGVDRRRGVHAGSRLSSAWLALVLLGVIGFFSGWLVGRGLIFEAAKQFFSPGPFSKRLTQYRRMPPWPHESGLTVSRLQESLARMGYLEGKPTGLFDEKTKQALRDFQRALNLSVNGEMDPPTQNLLLKILEETEEAS